MEADTKDDGEDIVVAVSLASHRMNKSDRLLEIMTGEIIRDCADISKSILILKSILIRA